MMTIEELSIEISKFKNNEIVICMNQDGVWDNIDRVEKTNDGIAIIFNDNAPFIDE